MFRYIVPVFAFVASASVALAGPAKTAEKPAAADKAAASDNKAADVKSGLAAGDAAVPFNVKDITGPNAGKSLCYRCQYSASPVATVFTKEITPEVADLIAKIDAQVGESKDKKMKAFVVLLTEDADAGAKQLKKLAEEKGIKNVPLTIYDGLAGPEKYKLSKDAAVTVLTWNKTRIIENHGFAAGKMTKDDVTAVAAVTAKVVG